MNTSFTLHIGTDFPVGPVSRNDGSAWANNPTVVLHSKDSRQAITADHVEKIDEHHVAVVFSAALTATLKPGMYDLEFYEASSKTYMLDCKENSVRAIIVSVSPASN